MGGDPAGRLPSHSSWGVSETQNAHCHAAAEHIQRSRQITYLLVRHTTRRLPPTTIDGLLARLAWSVIAAERRGQTEAGCRGLLLK